MEMYLVSVADCPHVSVLERRLRQVLGARADAVRLRVVADAEDALRWGMNGSPTLLVDGADPFASREQRPSLSCRFYRHPDGHLEGAPSVAQLRRALLEKE
jgi:hypothetical protein